MGKKEKQEIESLKSRNGDLEKKLAKDRNEAEKRLKEEKDNAKAVLADSARRSAVRAMASRAAASRYRWLLGSSASCRAAASGSTKSIPVT